MPKSAVGKRRLLIWLVKQAELDRAVASCEMQNETPILQKAMRTDLPRKRITLRERERDEAERIWNAIVDWFQADSPMKPHLPPIGSIADQWHQWQESLQAATIPFWMLFHPPGLDPNNSLPVTNRG